MPTILIFHTASTVSTALVITTHSTGIPGITTRITVRTTRGDITATTALGVTTTGTAHTSVSDLAGIIRTAIGEAHITGEARTSIHTGQVITMGTTTAMITTTDTVAHHTAMWQTAAMAAGTVTTQLFPGRPQQPGNRQPAYPKPRAVHAGPFRVAVQQPALQAAEAPQWLKNAAKYRRQTLALPAEEASQQPAPLPHKGRLR